MNAVTRGYTLLSLKKNDKIVSNIKLVAVCIFGSLYWQTPSAKERRIYVK